MRRGASLRCACPLRCRRRIHLHGLQLGQQLGALLALWLARHVAQHALQQREEVAVVHEQLLASFRAGQDLRGMGSGAGRTCGWQVVGGETMQGLVAGLLPRLTKRLQNGVMRVLGAPAGMPDGMTG